MTYRPTAEQLEAALSFHGHICPGFAYGVQAALLCINRFGRHHDAELVSLVETDSCGVDAIQFFTGCTLGKGNLILKDWGKAAYTFWRRSDGQGFRALQQRLEAPELTQQIDRLKQESPSPEREAQLKKAKTELAHAILAAEPESLFTIQPPQREIPRPERILTSLTCQACGEPTMESRVRLFDGHPYCIPCFSGVDQKG